MTESERAFIDELEHWPNQVEIVHEKTPTGKAVVTLANGGIIPENAPNVACFTTGEAWRDYLERFREYTTRELAGRDPKEVTLYWRERPNLNTDGERVMIWSSLAIAPKPE